MSQNIIISQIPDTDNLLETNRVDFSKKELENSRISPVWQRWLSQLQLFINQYFPPFVLSSATTGKVPRILFKLPEMSEIDRNALDSVENGVFIFNTTSGAINYYQAGSWHALP